MTEYIVTIQNPETDATYSDRVSAGNAQGALATAVDNTAVRAWIDEEQIGPKHEATVTTATTKRKIEIGEVV